MSFKETFSVILKVLSDFRVIGTVIVMLLIVEFAKFITNYTKKAPKPKKEKKSAAPVSPAPAAQPEATEGGETVE